MLCNIYGTPLIKVYDCHALELTHRLSTPIDSIANWLVDLATYKVGTDVYVKERYRMDTSSWVNGATAMACAQAALTYLHLWKYYDDESYLNSARSLVVSLEKGRSASGGFPMFIYDGHDGSIYTGGNSEVPISLFRMAEMDSENAETYTASGVKSTDYLLSIQNSDGSWRTVTNDATPTAMFTAQAIAAIAMGYKYSENKSTYAEAVEKGIAYIQTQLLSDGRIKTCREANPGTEYWRPPTSDQSIVVRGLAIAECYLSDNSHVSEWRELRHTLLDYLNDCIGPEGAVRNGYETTTLPNDVHGLTDHVYTTSWAIEAYYYSGVADSDGGCLDTSSAIVNFCANNLYYAESNDNANGVIRGAYNVQDGNWDTSALTQNGLNEGGSDMVYVGWVNAPILMWMIRAA